MGRVPIAKDAIPFSLALLGGGMVLLLFNHLLPAILLLGVGGFLLFFFRDPEREVPKRGGVILSPADGRVVAVELYTGEEAGAGELVQVSIFLSLFDVHINRAPLGAVVDEVRYRPGRFKVAYAREASIENEQNLIRFASPEADVWVKQIAGFLARRIACWVKPGQKVEAGERIGLIRFGSRVDLLLPRHAAVQVKVGDRVKGGLDIIATLSGGRIKVGEEHGVE